MISRSSFKTSALIVGMLLGGASAFIAQGQPPPGGPGFGGPMGGPWRSTAARMPLAALKAGLKLTSSQTSRIQSIQEKIRQQRGANGPGPGFRNGGPPNPAMMRGMFQKMRGQEAQADQDILATLSAGQKQALPGLLQQLDTLREAGIPLELYGDLKLTEKQKQRIAALVQKLHGTWPPPGPRGAGQPGRPGQGPPRQGGPGGPGPGMWGGPPDPQRQKVREQARAVLTSSQQNAVKAYRDAHPRPSFGGGPGGRPPGPPPPGA